MCVLNSHQIRAEYLHPSIPSDLAEVAIIHHLDPPAWWVSQRMAYIWRPNTELQQIYNNLDLTYGLGGFKELPMVGVHIRRTDKLKYDSYFYEVDEYMRFVSFVLPFLDRVQIAGAIHTIINKLSESFKDKQKLSSSFPSYLVQFFH